MSKKEIHVKRRLCEITDVVSFKLRFNMQSGKVTLIYADTEEKEEFVNVLHYLQDLNMLYRNRLEHIESYEGKLAVCETYLNQMYMYIIDLKSVTQDKLKDTLEKDIRLYIEQFEYFKRQYLEHKPVLPKEEKDTSLGTDEKIILLDYLGLLNEIKEHNITAETMGIVLSKLLDRSFDNIKKSMRNVGEKPKEFDAVKSKKRLETILKLAEDTNYDVLKSLVKIDLEKIEKK